MGKNKDIIKYPRLLLCEGMDEKQFLIAYINNLIASGVIEDELIEIRNFGGNEELTNYLRVLINTDGFEKVERISIIRDAETNYQTAEASIQSSILNSGIDKKFDCEIKYYLLPCKDSNGNWENGTLEDLAVQILCEDISGEAATQVLIEKGNALLSDIALLREKEFIRKHKNLLYTYFSCTDKFVTYKIGEAAKIGAFNWRSARLDNLKQFIVELAERKNQ